MRTRDRLRTYQEPFGVFLALLFVAQIVWHLLSSSWPGAAPTGFETPWGFLVGGLLLALMIGASGRLWMREVLDSSPTREHYFTFFAAIATGVLANAAVFFISYFLGAFAPLTAGVNTKGIFQVSPIKLFAVSVACVASIFGIFALSLFLWGLHFRPNEAIDAHVRDREDLPRRMEEDMASTANAVVQESLRIGNEQWRSFREVFQGSEPEGETLNSSTRPDPDSPESSSGEATHAEHEGEESAS